jgi:hypothetical protein
MRGTRFGFIGIFVSLLIAAVAGVIGYNVGLSAGIATTGDAGATHVVYAPWGFGFGGFGLIFGILFLVLIFSLFRRAAWGGWGGGYGRGGRGGYGGPGPDHARMPGPMEPALDDWHRRAHGDSPSTGEANSGTREPSQPRS